MRSLLGRFHRPFARSADEQLLLLNNLGDGSTLSLDFTTGVLDPRLTFTRSTNATFINSQGYVEWAAANLQIYSQDQSQSGTWVRQDLSGVDANVGATFDPLGGNTASKLKSAATLQAHLVYSTVSTSINAGLAYTFSVYVKKAELKHVALHLASTARYTVVFDLDTGAMTTTNTTGTPTGTAYSSASAGDGWWRLSITMNSQSSPVYPHICLSNSATPATNASGQPYYTGVLNEGVYTWGAQLNPGSSPLAYVATTTAQKFDTPRFDYDPSTLQPRGLLIEGSANNLATYSNLQAAWAGGTNTTVTANTTEVVSPDGTNNAAKVALTNTGYCSRFESISNLAASTTYTFSYWIRGTAGNQQRVYSVTASADLVTQTTLSYSTSGWTRVQITFTTTAALTTAYIYVVSRPTGTASDVIYIYGAQLETGSGASSYIPTGASTGSRAYDHCYATGANFTSWFSTGAGTVVAVSDNTKSNTQNLTAMISDGTLSNQVRMGRGLGGTSNEYLLTTVGGPSSFQGTADSGYNPPLNTVYKMAYAWDTNNFAVVVNNGSAVADTSGSLAGAGVLTQLVIGGDFVTTPLDIYFKNGHIRSLKYYPSRLANAQLQALTT